MGVTRRTTNQETGSNMTGQSYGAGSMSERESGVWRLRIMVATAKGPGAHGKRIVRRKVYAKSNTLTHSLLRGFGR